MPTEAPAPDPAGDVDQVYDLHDRALFLLFIGPAALVLRDVPSAGLFRNIKAA